MRPIAPLLAIAVAASLFGAGCGGGAAATPAAAAPSVAIKAFQFMPDTITVDAGQTITWSNGDATVHSVTAGTRKQPDRDAFDGDLARGETFSHTFDQPGTYAYYCDRHNGPGMTSKVVVK
jgi:plastocyanin